VLAAALALGCSSATLHAPDAGPRGANCGGTIDVKGFSPEGPFTATSVYVEVASNTPLCGRLLEFFVGDVATGSAFEFAIFLDDLADGAPFPLGETTVQVGFSGRQNTGMGLYQASTSATINVIAADPPPFPACQQAGGEAVSLGTGNIAMTLAMSQDDFAIGGTLSTPYCSCRYCPDTR